MVIHIIVLGYRIVKLQSTPTDLVLSGYSDGRVGVSVDWVKNKVKWFGKK